MPDNIFTELHDRLRTGGAPAVFEELARTLRETKEYHKLFDALCLAKKYELGVPLYKPTSFDDIPAEKHDEFEAAYIKAAREVGNLLVADKKLGQSFVYFHAIRETTAIYDAIEASPVPRESSDETEELIDLGLYKLIHPVKGMQILLKTHGTCNTITALDQVFMNLTALQRSECAALLVRTLHNDLMQSVDRDVKHRIPLTEPAQTLRELTAGRDWLFADNNYHVDVSHLQSTVRFARSISPNHPELALACDLAEYGVQLSQQFQYPGEPPFEEFYFGHLQFLRYLLNENRADAFAYFQRQLEAKGDSPDRAMVAYVMVDLLARTDQIDAALPLAEHYLLNADSNFGTAFAELCQQANRLDVLLRSAKERSDLVAYVAALVQQ